MKRTTTRAKKVSEGISAPLGLNFIAMADEIEELLGIKTDVVSRRSIKPKYLQSAEKDMVYVGEETFGIAGIFYPQRSCIRIKNFKSHFLFLIFYFLSYPQHCP